VPAGTEAEWLDLRSTAGSCRGRFIGLLLILVHGISKTRDLAIDHGPLHERRGVRYSPDLNHGTLLCRAAMDGGTCLLSLHGVSFRRISSFGPWSKANPEAAALIAINRSTSRGQRGGVALDRAPLYELEKKRANGNCGPDPISPVRRIHLGSRWYGSGPSGIAINGRKLLWSFHGIIPGSASGEGCS
jgi:hypothetical protein